MIKSDILAELKQSEDFVSGEALSNKFKISRTAVWKHINSLKKDGYEIVSITNKGYRLCGADVLSAEEITPLLKTKQLGRNIVCVHETESTNTLAKKENHMPDGTLFVADKQSAGRGRRGKGWESNSTQGLWMSLLLKPNIAPEELSCLTLAVGLAVCKALRKLTGARVMIKWPNDIVLEKKKLCGILCEMSCEVDSVSYAVCGIGVNLNTEKFDKDIDGIACSVKGVTGIKLCRSVVCAQIINCFEPIYALYLSGEIEKIITEYKECCITIAKSVTVIKGDRKINAYAVDVNEKGELVIRSDAGEECLSSGEVSVRGLFGYV